MPRKTKRTRKASPIIDTVAFQLIEVSPPKAKNLFAQLAVIWGAIGARLTATYGVRDIFSNVRCRTRVYAEVGVSPFEKYNRFSLAGTFIVLGFGGSFNVALLSNGWVVGGDIEVCTPVLELAASGCVNDPGTVLEIRGARKAFAASAAEAGASRRAIDARNAKRRATRAKNARRTARK
jgi:hypothetical protein